MAAKGTTTWDEDEDKKAKADKAKAESYGAKSKDEIDPKDPAAEPGNTGNAPTLGTGVKKTPTPAEDDEAKEVAKATNDKVNEALGGGYRKAAQIEGDAIRDGVSLLGKEAVTVQNSTGDPVIARRGMSETALANASATNPALAANNAVPTPTTGPVDQAEIDKLEEEGKVVVPLHGDGPQPSAG